MTCRRHNPYARTRKMPRMMYCAAVRRSSDTFSSRPNIVQYPVPSRQHPVFEESSSLRQAWVSFGVNSIVIPSPASSEEDGKPRSSDDFGRPQVLNVGVASGRTTKSCCPFQSIYFPNVFVRQILRTA